MWKSYIVHTVKIFLTQDIFGPRYFRPKIFLAQDIFGPRYFWPKIFLAQDILGQDILGKRYFRSKIFWVNGISQDILGQDILGQDIFSRHQKMDLILFSLGEKKRQISTFLIKILKKGYYNALRELNSFMSAPLCLLYIQTN